MSGEGHWEQSPKRDCFYFVSLAYSCHAASIFAVTESPVWKMKR